MDPSGLETRTARLTIQAEEFAIYDDFLAANEFAALAAFANNSNYHEVHEKGVRKVWRLHDGSPLQGETAYLRADTQLADSQSTTTTSQRAIHNFLARLNEVVDENSRLIGERLTRWKSVSAAPWIYPSGTGLSLHADSSRYSGSYTFFLHPKWGLHWGGYLMIFNPARYCAETRAPYSAGLCSPGYRTT